MAKRTNFSAMNCSRCWVNGTWCWPHKLRNRQCHRAPLTRPLGDGLFELRHVGKLNTRVLWCFMRGRRITAVHGIRNKGQVIPARDLDTAHERMRDWKQRNET